MGALNVFKLEKLRIKAYTDPERKTPAPEGVFDAMFNPASFKQSYGIEWGGKQGKGSSDKDLEYSRSLPTELEMKLILDGTGVHEWKKMSLLALRGAIDETRVAGARLKGEGGPAGPGRPSVGIVEQQVRQFLKLTFSFQGDIHQPYYLWVGWGRLSFSCRLKSVAVNYTMFSRGGMALRAELDVVFVADDDIELALNRAKLSSPDLTHRRTVRSGDTLPWLCQQIYGSSDRFLEVARFNDLDDFRSLQPGQELFFPPLDRLMALLGESATRGPAAP